MNFRWWLLSHRQQMRKHSQERAEAMASAWLRI